MMRVKMKTRTYRIEGLIDDEAQLSPLLHSIVEQVNVMYNDNDQQPGINNPLAMQLQ